MTDILTYRLHRDSRREYPAVLLDVALRSVRRVSDDIAGCVGNAAGYQDQEAADRQLARFAALRNLGHAEYLEGARGSEATVTFRWQEWRPRDGGEPGYCGHGIGFGGGAWWEDWHTIEQGRKLALRIGKLVERARFATRSPADREATGPRMRLFTDAPDAPGVETVTAAK